MRILSVLAVLLLSGCSNVPVAIKNAPTPDLQLRQTQADSANHQGQNVRWGGQIVKVENTNNGTTLQIAQFPLSSYGRPVTDRESDGRFLVKTTKFVDPTIYKKGTLITVAGQLTDNQTVTVDKKTLSLPVVNSKELYRWINNDYRRDPFYGPGYYGSYYGPYYRSWHGYPYYRNYYW